MDSEPIVHFREWVRSIQKTGKNGYDTECPYVPPSLLKQYWAIENVREVLDACNLHENALQIRERFVRSFSTLVYIGQPEKIGLFIRKDHDDVHLPITEPPHGWLPFLQDFLDQQWMFCPLEFSDALIFKRELPPLRILPVTYLESLRGETWCGEGASTQKVQIHPECNTMTGKDTHVVFKIFKGSHMRSLYKAEADVYSRLSEMQKAQKNIARHYGSFSFELTNTRVIILEYAAMGSLLDFFRDVPPPTSPDESEMFWRELLKLMAALHAFQTLNRPPIDGRPTNGFAVAVHQDIQPTNILVFPHPPKDPPREESRFDVRFKLADFGLAEFSRVSELDEQFTIQNEGNRMYGAPECYPNHAVQSEVRPQVTTKVDVWSIGAVLSDALVWSKSGEAGREEYRTCRKEAIAKLDHIKARGFEACFHDGEHVLDVVHQFHAKVIEDEKGSGNISERMSEFILLDMLTDASRRACADTLIRHADKVMHGQALDDSSQSSQIPQTRDLGQVSTLSEDPTVHTHHDHPHRQPHPRAMTPQTQPPVSSDRTSGQNFNHMPGSRALAPVERMYAVLEKKRPRRPYLRLLWDVLRGRSSETVTDPLGMDCARSKIMDFRGRVQIIVIDNFASMKPHMKQVAMTARVISYITKVADNNRVALFFASDPTRSWKCSTSKEVESTISRMKSVDGKCSMKICLLNITERLLENGKNGIKPIGIYVYTDGVWEGINDVKSVIQKSIRQLVKVKGDPSRIMFQFIRFGNDGQGRARLEELDDDCQEVHDDTVYDIVDTKPWNSDVAGIVIGSISAANDKEKATTSRQSQGHRET